MTSKRTRIIVVGAGPTGISTALYLARMAPDLAAEVLVLEAQTHPRPKLCGGGITFHGEEQLEHLGIDIDVPAFDVHRITFKLGKRQFSVRSQNAMRIIKRSEFDAALLGKAEDAGVCIHQDERLLDLHPTDGGYDVVTNRDRYEAAVVIGADGAKSTVRRKLRLFDTVTVARLLRVLTPVDTTTDPNWQTHNAVFDFSCVYEGVQGYAWDFPCIVDGQPHMNRGIFDSRIAGTGHTNERERHSFKRVFLNTLERQHIDPEAVHLQGHPVRWFKPEGTFSKPHVLLAGDAAGVDPLFAEGISYGMEYGAIAAEAVRDAFHTGDFTFEDYRSRLMQHKLGQSLKRRATVAKLLYGHPDNVLWSLLWRAAAVSPAGVRRWVGSTLDVLPPEFNIR